MARVLSEFEIKDENTRVFLVINTTKYDGQGIFSTRVVEVAESEFDSGAVDNIMGWDINERYPLLLSVAVTCDVRPKDMEVNDIIITDDYEGAYLMRVK